MTESRTVAVPGAHVAYFVSGDLARCTPDDPPLMLIGSPMDSTGFGSLAARMADRALVTYDPRTCGRSRRDDPTAAVTPSEHGADLHAVIAAVGVGAVDLFASSGGAVNALALVATHPADVRTLVAHEPPAGGVLPDRDEVGAAVDDVLARYDRDGLGAAMATFLPLIMHRGPVTEAFLHRPPSDPAMFGLPTDDDGARNDPMMANLRGGGADFVPDVDALRAAPTRLVLGVGEESGGPDDGEIAARAGYAVAAALGLDAAVFPSGHGGFLGGEFGQHGKPDEFATTLREVLDA